MNQSASSAIHHRPATAFKKKIRRIRARLETVGIVLARWLFTRCSRRHILRVARVMGDCAYYFSRRHIRYARANLDVIYGQRLSERRRRAILRASCRHATQVLLDLFWFTHDGQARVEQWVGVDADLRAWLHDNPGSIIVTGHLGNWEVAGQSVIVQGYPLTSVAKRIGTRTTTKRINHHRRTLGQKIVMKDGAIRGLVRALKMKEFIALLLDQHVDPADGGVWIDFFGLQASSSSSAARLAMKFQVPIGVCFAQALPDGRYQCRLLGVLQAQPEADVVALTQQIMNHLAKGIYRYPSQWLLSYKRWKRWPPGADASRYPFYAREWNT